MMRVISLGAGVQSTTMALMAARATRSVQQRLRGDVRTMKSGDKITYMCLAGIRGAAWVRCVRPDGTVDIGCDVRSKDLHELSRIEIVPPADLRPGTCCEGEGK